MSIRPPIEQAVLDELRAEILKTLPPASGVEYRLDDDAFEFHDNRYKEERSKSGVSDTMNAASARNDGMALKVALLYAVAERTPTIQREQLEAAWAVADYSRTVAEFLVGQVRAHSMREAEQKLLDACQRVAKAGNGTFTKRAIRQRVKGKTGMDAELFNRTWNSLLAAGDIVETDVQGTYRVAP